MTTGTDDHHPAIFFTQLHYHLTTSPADCLCDDHHLWLHHNLKLIPLYYHLPASLFHYMYIIIRSSEDIASLSDNTIIWLHLHHLPSSVYIYLTPSSHTHHWSSLHLDPTTSSSSYIFISTNVSNPNLPNGSSSISLSHEGQNLEILRYCLSS